jgi:hypothetical protein
MEISNLDYHCYGLINLERGDKVEIIKMFPDTTPNRVALMRNLTKSETYKNNMENAVTAKSSILLANPIVGEITDVEQVGKNTYFSI